MSTRTFGAEITEGSCKSEVLVVAGSSFLDRTYEEVVIDHSDKVGMCLQMKSCRRVEDERCGRGEMKEIRSHCSQESSRLRY